MVEAVSCAGLENQNSSSENFFSLEEQLPVPNENERFRIKNWQQIRNRFKLAVCCQIIGNANHPRCASLSSFNEYSREARWFCNIPRSSEKQVVCTVVEHGVHPTAGPPDMVANCHHATVVRFSHQRSGRAFCPPRANVRSGSRGRHGRPPSERAN